MHLPGLGPYELILVGFYVPGVGPYELTIVGCIALLLFGKWIPQLVRSLGRGLSSASDLELVGILKLLSVAVLTIAGIVTLCFR